MVEKEEPFFAYWLRRPGVKEKHEWKKSFDRKNRQAMVKKGDCSATAFYNQILRGKIRMNNLNEWNENKLNLFHRKNCVN